NPQTPDLVMTTDPQFGGNDEITTGSGNDLILAGSNGSPIDDPGNDLVTPGEGNDAVVGDNGKIVLVNDDVRDIQSIDTPCGGDDVLLAGTGHNLLIGGVGNDNISAGSGRNVVVGDSGQATEANGILSLVTTLDPAHGGADTIHTGPGGNLIV